MSTSRLASCNMPCFHALLCRLLTTWATSSIFRASCIVCQKRFLALLPLRACSGWQAVRNCSPMARTMPDALSCSSTP
eukprot:6191597-Pleurochrysis_carterae.AAC.2